MKDQTVRALEALPVTALAPEQATPEACAEAMARQRRTWDALLAEADEPADWDEGDARDYADRCR